MFWIQPIHVLYDKGDPVDLRQLRYFLAIAEAGSITRAAEHLNVAQPALSLHVKNMDADLGVPLPFRSARGVEPTEAGAILLHHARVILERMAAPCGSVRRARSRISSPCR